MRRLRRLLQDRKSSQSNSAVASGSAPPAPQAVTIEDSSLKEEVGDARVPSENQVVSGILPQTREGITNDGSGSSQAFRSLVERSITAWHSLTFVGEDKDTSIQRLSSSLRALDSVEALMGSRQLFWFFQLRHSFMQQHLFMKWDSDCLDDYVLLPVEYGFANKQDCFFVSHYWRTQEHPDPKGEDYRLIREDLGNTEWSYVWLDWTCLPQGPRSESHKGYFKTILRRIPMLVRDCAWEWRYPAFEPRLWILFEVGVNVVFHLNFTITADIKPFTNDVQEMINEGVGSILDKRGYKCTNESDTELVTGWLELQILLFKLVPQATTRRALFDHIDQPYAGSITDYETGMEVDKANGLIFFRGRTYDFTPIFHETLGHSNPHATPEFSVLQKILTTREEQTLVQSLETDEKTRGPEHPVTLLGLEVMAEILAARRLYKVAERFRRRVLKSREMALGSHHKDTLDSAHKVTAVLHMQKRYNAAGPFYQRYLSGTVK